MSSAQRTSSKKSIKSILKRQETKSEVIEPDYIETWVVVPPDGGWGWFVVFIAFLCNFLIDGTTYTFGVFLEDIGKSFNVHPTKVAWSSSLMNGLYYFAGPLSCALSNRFGFRMVAMIGGAIATITYLVASFMTNLTAFILIHGVCGGIGFNLVYSPCILVVGFYFERWRALATAISVTGTAVGIMTFPPLITSLMGDLSWRTKFQIFSGLFATIILLALAFKPIQPTRVLEEKKEASVYEIDDGDDASIGTCDIANEARAGFFTRLFNRFHNLLYPTIAQVASDPGLILSNADLDHSEYDTSTVVRDFSGRMPAGSVILSEAGFSKTYNNKDDDDTKLSRLSVVYEDGDKKRACCACCSCCKCHVDGHLNRPLYRDDIFYAGSVWNLPEFKKSKASMTQPKPGASRVSSKYVIPSMSYHMAVTRTLTKQDVEQSRRCVCCPEAIVRILVTMMDLRLFKNKAFIVLTISGFLTNTGMYLPFIYTPQRGLEIGLSHNWSTMLLTIIGISNAIGRVFCGLVSSIPHINTLVVSCITTIITGGSVLASFFITSLEGQIICAILFGVDIASFTALRSAVIADMMGLENLTNAFGITIMFYGLGCFIGPIAAGEIQNASGSYGYIFIFSGILILLSAVLLIPIPKIMKMEEKKKSRKVKFRSVV